MANFTNLINQLETEKPINSDNYGLSEETEVAEALNDYVLPRLAKFKHEIAECYEGKTKFEYVIDAGQKLLKNIKKAFNDEIPIYVGTSIQYPIENDVDARAAMWLGMCCDQKGDFKTALMFYNTTYQFYQTRQPKQVEKLVFLNCARSLCQAKLDHPVEAAREMKLAEHNLNTELASKVEEIIKMVTEHGEANQIGKLKSYLDDVKKVASNCAQTAKKINEENVL